MPTGRVELIPMVVNAVRECDVNHEVITVLDVGCGSGFYGAALRQYLDFAHNRFDDDRKLKIVGVEGHDGYQSPNLGHYDEIHTMLLQDFLEKDDRRFDVALALAVLEHLELDQAREIMLSLYERTDKYFIITSPSTFREQWQPENKWENDLQDHRCFISPDMLESLFPRYRVEMAPGGLVWMGIIKNEYLPM